MPKHLTWSIFAFSKTIVWKWGTDTVELVWQLPSKHRCSLLSLHVYSKSVLCILSPMYGSRAGTRAPFGVGNGSLQLESAAQSPWECPLETSVEESCSSMARLWRYCCAPKQRVSYFVKWKVESIHADGLRYFQVKQLLFDENLMLNLLPSLIFRFLECLW